MGIVFQTVFGVLAIAVASVLVWVSVTDRFDSAGEKLGVMAVGVLLFGIGVWLAWPLALLIADWWTDSERLARFVENREAKDVERIASEARAFASTAVALAIANVPGAVVLAHLLRKDRPASIERWFMPATVLLVSAVVLAAKVQAWTGAVLPLGRFLATVNGSIEAAGVAAFLVLWASIWMGAIGARLVAALPMGPIAAFVTPIAAMPFYYGDYRDYGWGWMALLWLASVLLGFVVNVVREAENDRIEEARNKSAEALYARVLAAAESGSVPDYVLFLRPFRGTGTLDTQSGGEAVEALDLETILARALKPRWLVGLGSEMERSIVGAGRVYFRDVEWWDSVRVLARHAMGIVVVPSTNEGTLREIRWLHEERLLSKCVFVMPPTPGEGRWHVDLFGSSTVLIKNDTAADQSALWSAARAALRESPGIELPPHSAQGALLGLDAQGQVIRTASLDLGGAFFKVRRLRRAILTALPTVAASA
jgi:hypothetical protein